MKNKMTLLRITVILTVLYALPSLAQNGSLDLTFNTDGLVTTPIGNSYDFARAVAIQSDGKIIVAGYRYGDNFTNNDFALTRYNTNGSLDTTFDTDGIVTTAIGTSGDYVYAVAIQSDGKIVVAGNSYSGINDDFAVVRYNSNGSLDTSFSGDGIVTTSIETDAYGYAVTIQSDGKIVVTGNSYSNNGSISKIAVARYNTNGSLDNTFDSDGIVTTSIGTDDYGTAVVLQSNGKIVVAGYSDNGTNKDFAVVRYNTNGSLDNTFDSDGIVTTAIGTSDDRGTALTLQNDGKIVVAGFSDNGTDNDFALVRYNPNGSLDTTFDSDGRVTTAIAASYDIAHALLIQSDGKILVAGETFNGIDNDFALVRYNTNGSLDNTFGTDGITTTPIGPEDDNGYAVAIQNDGKIVVAGSSRVNGVEFALARYNNTIPLGINSIDNQTIEIKAFPNPFSTATTFQSDTFLKNATLTVYNLIGKQVYQLNNISGKSFFFQRQNLTCGLYFFMLTQDNKIIFRNKLIIAD
ncbi:T9SS type A sorting domain-containing protein [Flavobacterium sp.]|uniref:T9SS type A sorting domain-containing protein n=1 Tax=Flavobacterium sp. TaxID=239 RepID=UPI00286C86BF|nr:T9SS type A sorting domain-containing protein [Flavobacterium sp.]